MLGAIIGDIIGSVYEFRNIRKKDFQPLFHPQCFYTDDSVLTIALADAILTNRPYQDLMREYYQRYPDRGYGGMFHSWAQSSNPMPSNSWGNGAAMRISPTGFAYSTLEEVLIKAKAYTEITHNHPEGIKGAQATAAAIFLARQGKSKEDIKTYIMDAFGYDLSPSYAEIYATYKYTEACQDTVPQAIIAFLTSNDFEDAIRLAIALGGDSDTLACICGSIAHAYYGEIPPEIAQQALAILDDKLREVTLSFLKAYSVKV